MMAAIRWSVLTAALLLPASSAEVVYFCDANGNVGMIDTATMATTTVGNLAGFSIGQVLGMAYDPMRDALIIMDRQMSGNMYTMDPSTGVATLLFTAGRQFQGGAIIGDDLWGIDESAQTFLAYSLTSGTVSITGSACQGHSHGMGLDATTGQLYARNTNNELYEVSAAGAAGTTILTGTSGVEDIDYLPASGDFVGVNYSRDLFLIDGTTGAATVLLDTAQLSAVGVTGSMSGVAVRQTVLTINNVDTMPTTVAPGQTGIAVTMEVENPGGNAVNLNSADLTFVDSMTLDVTAEYTVTPAPGNPTTIPAGGVVTLDFSVDVTAMMTTLGTITLDGMVTATDSMTMAMLSASGAQVTDTWDVIGAVPQVLSVSTTPAMVHQGSTGHAVLVDVTNVGLLDMTVGVVNLTFTGTADRTSEYTVTPDPMNPTSIAVGATEFFQFTVDVSTMATVELVILDAGITGMTTLTGGLVDDPDADTTDSWIVEMCGATLCGDCNGDMLLTILDALTAAQHAAALITLTGVDFTNCNVIGAVEPDPAAEVTVLDALTLAQAAAALPVMLVCC